MFNNFPKAIKKPIGNNFAKATSKNERLGRLFPNKGCFSYRVSNTVNALYPKRMLQINEGIIYVPVNNNSTNDLHFLDRKTGAVLWSKSFFVSSHIFSYEGGDTIFANGYIYHLCWRSSSSSVAATSFILKISLAGDLIWVNALTSSTLCTALAYSNGLLYCLTTNSTQTVCMQPKIFNDDGSTYSLVSATKAVTSSNLVALKLMKSSSGATPFELAVFQSTIGLGYIPQVNGVIYPSFNGGSGINAIVGCYLDGCVTLLYSSSDGTFIRSDSTPAKTVFFNFKNAGILGVDSNENLYLGINDYAIGQYRIIKLDKALNLVWCKLLSFYFNGSLNYGLYGETIGIFNNRLYAYFAHGLQTQGFIIIINSDGKLEQSCGLLTISDITSSIDFVSLKLTSSLRALTTGSNTAFLATFSGAAFAPTSTIYRI